jgi:hypothetical protein
MRPLQSGTMGWVPDLWYYQVCKSLITAERKGRAAEQVVTLLVADFEPLAEFLEANPTTPSLLVTAAAPSPDSLRRSLFGTGHRRRLPLATLDAHMPGAKSRHRDSQVVLPDLVDGTGASSRPNDQPRVRQIGRLATDKGREEIKSNLKARQQKSGGECVNKDV